MLLIRSCPQVTVAHINATAKNAADDKLRQSLRRFADTHTAPATVVLVSCEFCADPPYQSYSLNAKICQRQKSIVFSPSFTADVNFASELSDLRHRHGFRVILIHGSQTSSALLQHAHCHVPFQEITADLPPCMLVKSQVGFH